MGKPIILYIGSRACTHCIDDTLTELDARDSTLIAFPSLTKAQQFYNSESKNKPKFILHGRDLMKADIQAQFESVTVRRLKECEIAPV